MECSICCETTELLELQCSCQICSCCMLKSIDAKYYEVIEEIHCPGSCQSKHIVLGLMMNLKGLNDLLLEKYIKTTQDIRICPKNDCQYSGIIKNNCQHFECKCGYQFKIIDEKWNLRSIFLNFITIKDCPQCQRRIFKNGGCNHMTCKCQYEFCWICTQNFKQHNKFKCSLNIITKISLFILMFLNIVYSLRLLVSFMTVVLIFVKLTLFNGSLIFLYLGINELYQISKLNFECSKYYSNGNETFKRIINQKWIMFTMLMSQFFLLCFFFYLCYQEQFFETYCHFLCSEFSIFIVLGTTLWIKSQK
ncbi:unnamed protein product [Paramecium pentaurelia]|uniref:RBR-type E3 ubiquitin transferase n=1 Tax=Paramecium pentaurelia TaxID=43138 RepID=A0A8S1WPI3_9CILI|nr:unnamed protein product [Paramecium pentaurelia]